MSRIKEQEYYLTIAKIVAERSTCVRRKVGCVLLDSFKKIIATGYNGVPRGVPHCIDAPCAGAKYTSGEGLDECLAVHAEANALIQCQDQFEIFICVSTTFPCIHCLKMLMNTSCEIILYAEDYDNEVGKRLWQNSGRTMIHVPKMLPTLTSANDHGNTPHRSSH
jgi:dCMP deaminase